MKSGCVTFTGCPHGKRKNYCAICNPCPHSRVKNDCPAWKAERAMEHAWKD